MREVTEIVKVYKWDTAPQEVKDNIKEQFANCPYHYEHCMQERVDTLTSLAEILDAELDYSLSAIPSRGEYIKLTPLYSSGLDYDGLISIVKDGKSCPLTGVCYDHDILDHINVEKVSESLDYALNKYIESIHNEYEWTLSDEYIADMCQANEYEFTANGKIY